MSIVKSKTIQVTFTIVAVAVLLGCNLSSPCRQVETNRFKSPDGKVDAVIIKKDCGATTSESYNVFVVASGKEAKGADLVFKADHVEGLYISWRQPKFLDINYNQARIFQFMNFWQSKDVDSLRYVVEVRETALSH
jgi:hypothetical protein